MFLGTRNHRSWLLLVMEERGEICLTLRKFFATGKVVRVFSDVLVAFSYFDICHYQNMANIKIWKSHLNIREGSDYWQG